MSCHAARRTPDALWTQNPYEAKRLRQLLEERASVALAISSVSEDGEDAAELDEVSVQLRKKVAEMEAALKAIEIEPTSLTELLTLQSNLTAAKKTAGLDPARLAAGETRLTSSAARLMNEEAGRRSPDRRVLAGLTAVATEVGVASAQIEAAQRVCVPSHRCMRMSTTPGAGHCRIHWWSWR